MMAREVVVTVLLFATVIHALQDYKVTPVSVVWTEGNTTCNSLGYKLLDWKNTSVQASSLTSVLEPNKTYWTGRYYMKTAFYWKLGCYDIGGKGKSFSNSTDFGQDNSLFVCSMHCRIPEYIGLEGTRCHCYTESPSLGVESNGICNTKCPGNVDDTCGDINKMTLYRMLDKDKEGFDGNSQADDCFSINKETQEELYDYYSDFETFQADTCLERKGYVCESSTPDKITGDVYSIVNTKVTWFEADQSCLKKGMRLAYFNSVNAPGLLTKDTVPDGAMFWIGLYRQMYTGTLEHEDIEDTPFRCEGIRLSDTGIKTVRDICNRTRPAACEMKSEIPVQLSTQEMETTTSTPESSPELTTADMSTMSEYVTTVESLITTDDSMTTEGSILTTQEPMVTSEGLVITTQEPMMTTEGLIVTTQGPMLTTMESITTDQPAFTTKDYIRTTVFPEIKSSLAKTAMSTTEELVSGISDELNNAGKVGKNVGRNEGDSADHDEPSLLIIILITLAVLLLIVLILLAFAYRRYRRNKRYQKVKIYGGYYNNTLCDEPDNVECIGSEPKCPPTKPIRQNSMKLNDQVNNNSTNLLPVPETRDDISWNLPFIDASRATLDNIDESKPVIVRKSVLLSNSESIVGKEVDAGEDVEDNDDVFANKTSQTSLDRKNRSSYSDQEPDETEPLNQDTFSDNTDDKHEGSSLSSDSSEDNEV